jgi:hypothetical protein
VSRLRRTKQYVLVATPLQPAHLYLVLDEFNSVIGQKAKATKNKTTKGGFVLVTAGLAKLYSACSRLVGCRGTSSAQALAVVRLVLRHAAQRSYC